jgi:hypothetical protein
LKPSSTGNIGGVRWAVAGAAVVVLVTLLLVPGFLLGTGHAVYLVLLLGAIVATARLLVEDAKARARRGGWWLVGCVVFGPVGLAAFLVVAVLDRARGRLGIEGRWPSPARWYFLAGVVTVVAAASLAFAPLSVRGLRVSAPGAYADVSGSCLSALNTALAGPPYGTTTPDVRGFAAVVANEEHAVNRRCSVASTRRLGMSAVLVVGGLLLGLIGARDRPRRLAPSRAHSGTAPTAS